MSIKKCANSNCLIPEKDESEFHFLNKNEGSRQRTCKVCRSEYKKLPQVKAQNRKHAKEDRILNPEKYSERNLKNRGLSREKYDKLFKSQNGVCAVCCSPQDWKSCTGKIIKNRLVIDHDHSCCPGEKSCGKCVRGLLCSNCNTAAGLLNDDPDIIWRLSQYIINHLAQTGDRRMEWHCGF